MEMCLDNPREEFSDIFATHPPIEQRIQAIIKFAGGHDPGPLALPEEAPGQAGAGQAGAGQAEPGQARPGPGEAPPAAPAGPWSDPATTGAAGPLLRPFLPGPAARPPGDGNPAADEPGPWGPHNKN
jgi:heat shock protein HtpX